MSPLTVKYSFVTDGQDVLFAIQNIIINKLLRMVSSTSSRMSVVSTMTLALCSSLRSRNNTFEDLLGIIICNFIIQNFSETFNQIESKKARNNLLKEHNSK